jgi:hypothetical protein
MISRAQAWPRASSAAALGTSASHLLAECAHAFTGLELGDWVGEVLSVGRGSGMAVNHALILDQIFAS